MPSLSLYFPHKHRNKGTPSHYHTLVLTERGEREAERVRKKEREREREREREVTNSRVHVLYNTQSTIVCHQLLYARTIDEEKDSLYKKNGALFS